MKSAMRDCASPLCSRWCLDHTRAIRSFEKERIFYLRVHAIAAGETADPWLIRTKSDNSARQKKPEEEDVFCIGFCTVNCKGKNAFELSMVRD
jgi:hypothetical protein